MGRNGSWQEISNTPILQIIILVGLGLGQNTHPSPYSRPTPALSLPPKADHHYPPRLCHPRLRCFTSPLPPETAPPQAWAVVNSVERHGMPRLCSGPWLGQHQCVCASTCQSHRELSVLLTHSLLCLGRAASRGAVPGCVCSDDPDTRANPA